MKIGDRVYVYGYIDEIRKDVVIIRNSGGYFGTVKSEIIVVETKVVETKAEQKMQNDNHGELIRCINCKKYNPNAGDNKELGYCLMLGSNRVPRDGYCAWAIKREEGEEYPQVVKGAFPQ